MKKICKLGMAMLLGLSIFSTYSASVLAGDVVLKYASWDTDQAIGLRKVLDAFEEANPGIKVEMETTPWDQYWVKLEAAATGANLPDVVTMHSSQSHKYIEAEMLMNLDELVNEYKIDMSTFEDGISDFYTLDDSLYAIPKDASLVALWFNKTLFDDAGVEYPNENWTWDDFLDAALKLTDEEKGIYGFAADNNNETGYWSFIYQAGGSVYSEDGLTSTFNTPEVQEAMQFYIDLHSKHNVSPDVATLQETSKISLFQSGKLAMMIEGNWHTSSFAQNEYTREHAGVAPMPKGKQHATIINGLGWSGSAHTKYPEETKKLLAFLSSDEANAIQAETGTSIPAKKGHTDKYISAMNVFDLSAFDKMLDYGYARPYNPLGLNCEIIEREALNAAFSGQKSIEEVTAEIEQQVNNLLKDLQ